MAILAKDGGDIPGRHQVRRDRLQFLEPLGDRVQLVTEMGVLGLDPPAPPVTRAPAEPVQAGRGTVHLALLMLDGGGWEPEHLGDQRQQSFGVLAVQRIGNIAIVEVVGDGGVPVADLERLHRTVGREP